MTNKSWQDGSLTYVPAIGAEVGDLRYRNQNGGNRSPSKPVVSQQPNYGYVTRSLWSTGKAITVKYRKRPWPPVTPKRVKNEPHNYSMTHYHKVNFQVDYVDQFGTTKYRGCQEAFGKVVSPANIWTSNDDIKLLAKLQERALGHEFNLGVFLGEGHQSLALIGDSATRIYNSLRKLRRGRLREAWTDLIAGTQRSRLPPPHKVKWINPSRIDERKYADLWIEMQYGWKPLLSDVYSLGEALGAQLSEPFSMKYSARRRVHEEGTVVTPIENGVEFVTGTYYTSRGKQIRTILSEKPGFPQLTRLDNPLTVAWELLPWSFVIDWFIPIGQWLDARGATSLINAGSITSTLDTEHGYVTFRGRKSLFHFDVLNRVVGGTTKVPLPSFKPFGKAASWQHCANAVALLIQQTRRSI